ncbi:MAG: CoA pyrophosphatase [Alphaproteobacteria bacterium]|nr:CoA pyrophosphatase [Alphaproteobacteria bacterium]MBE8219776.1 CoA pyrophosphatase [Alphaproteobacteria bacterium]
MDNYRHRICTAINPDLPSAAILYETSGQTGDNVAGHDFAPKPNSALTLASVLMPITTYHSEPHILLTQRASHLQKHSGQVAFPGGKVEADDATPIAAALREAHEEVGLPPAQVEVAGVLDTYETGTGFRILPVVGFIADPFTAIADVNEVAHIFEVPLTLALNADNYKEHKVMWQGKHRRYHALEYQGFNIWGATAGMLLNLAKRL